MARLADDTSSQSGVVVVLLTAQFTCGPYTYRQGVLAVTCHLPGVDTLPRPCDHSTNCHGNGDRAILVMNSPTEISKMQGTSSKYLH